MGYYVTTMGRKGRLYWNEEKECWEGDQAKGTIFNSKEDAEEITKWPALGKLKLIEVAE